MNAKTDKRVGKYLSSTGVIHATATCGGRRGSFGTSKGTLLTAEDVAYWIYKGVNDHKFCQRCNEVTA